MQSSIVVSVGVVLVVRLEAASSNLQAFGLWRGSLGSWSCSSVTTGPVWPRVYLNEKQQTQIKQAIILEQMTRDKTRRDKSKKGVWCWCRRRRVDMMVMLEERRGARSGESMRRSHAEYLSTRQKTVCSSTERYQSWL
jgi:hypothetical protein